MPKSTENGDLSGVSIVILDDAYQQRKSSVQEKPKNNLFRSFKETIDNEIKEAGEDDEDEISNDGGLTGKLDHYF
jgi:hypothetical protein